MERLKRFIPEKYRSAEFWEGVAVGVFLAYLVSAMFSLIIAGMSLNQIVGLLLTIAAALAIVWLVLWMGWLLSVIVAYAWELAKKLLLRLQMSAIKLTRNEALPRWVRNLIRRILQMQPQKLSLGDSIAQRLMQLRGQATVDVFLSDPTIAQFDKIVVFMFGGGGGFPRVIKAALDRYEQLRSLIKVVVVDFEVDPGKVDKRWGILDLGEKLDMTLQGAVNSHGIPEGLFADAELSELKAYLKEAGHHQFAYGAGANPLVGRLGFKYTEAVFESFVHDWFTTLKSKQNVKKLLPIAVIGTGGGTGYGIADQAMPIIASLAKTLDVDGLSGVIALHLAWRAYSGIIYAHTGEPTSMADHIWKRSMRAWNEKSNAFFLATECGPDGFLAALMTMAYKASVLNNAPQLHGHPNALLSVEEVGPWTAQRMASFLGKRFRVERFGQLSAPCCLAQGMKSRLRWTLINFTPCESWHKLDIFWSRSVASVFCSRQWLRLA